MSARLIGLLLWTLRPLSHRLSLLLVYLAILFPYVAQAGTWNITVNYSGSYTVSSNGTLQVNVGPASSGSITGGGSSTNGGITGSYSQSLVVGLPKQGGTGWILPSRRSAVARQSDADQPSRRRGRYARCLGSRDGQDTLTANLSVSGQMTFTITWVPDNGNDPAPANIAIYYRRQQQSSATAFADFNGEYAEADVSGGVDNLQRAAEATSTTAGSFVTNTPPPLYDPAFVRKVLSLSGNSAQVSFTLSGNFNATVTQNKATEIDTTKASASLAYYVDLCVAGVDLGRFGGPLKDMGGDHRGGATDPSFTRWLPLAFSPQMTSQPFRTLASSILPAPWGNINCAYSIGIAQEPNPPNYDLDGVYLTYIPSLGSDGHFDHGFGPFQTQPGAFIPKYAITDANGDRLVFDANWNPYENVHSTIVV